MLKYTSFLFTLWEQKKYMLTTPSSVGDKETMHIEIDLSGSCLSWISGEVNTYILCMIVLLNYRLLLYKVKLIFFICNDNFICS